MLDDLAMGEETLAKVWSTTSGGEHHPLDGSTSESMVNGVCVCVCVHVCVCTCVCARVYV